MNASLADLSRRRAGAVNLIAYLMTSSKIDIVAACPFAQRQNSVPEIR